MLQFSKIATLEKNKLSTDAPFLLLFDITCKQCRKKFHRSFTGNFLMPQLFTYCYQFRLYF